MSISPDVQIRALKLAVAILAHRINLAMATCDEEGVCGIDEHARFAVAELARLAPLDATVQHAIAVIDWDASHGHPEIATAFDSANPRLVKASLGATRRQVTALLGSLG